MVIRMDRDMARLIVLSGTEAVCLGECAVFGVKAVYKDLSVTLNSSLCHNEEECLCLIPDALVREGDGSLFSAWEMCFGDDITETAVCVSLNYIDSAALKSSND